jgi:uncharacterized protein (DUF2235 family)
VSKNIVICCDGTANEFAANLTNVVKLYSVLTYQSGRQITFYHPGLGTMEPAGVLTSLARKITKLMGMAFGYGLADDIRDAYVFLMKNYEPDDRIFLFGFSRGAYTARAVCSLLKLYGLIRKDNESLVPYATRLLMGIERGKTDQTAVAQYFKLADGFRSTLAADCKPWFVGVWDTVSSVGWVENPLKLPYIANNPDIQIGRHAVSIDERRAFFRTNLWRLPSDGPDCGPRDLKQVWFVGDHCDVGGGYAEAESGLSKIALEWMVREAISAGLEVDQNKVNEVLGCSGSGQAAPDPNARAHESLAGWWHLAELVPKKHYDWATGKTNRKMNFWRPRTIPPKSLIHASAFQRANYRVQFPPDSIQVTTSCSEVEHAKNVARQPEGSHN